MIKLMDKGAIIKLKEQGYSNRQIQKLTKIDRKTVSKYWNEYLENLKKLSNEKDSLKIIEIQEAITSEPRYNVQSRMRRKLTDDFFVHLKDILNSEEAAIEYMESILIKLNENSKIEEEKLHLKTTKPPLELANIKESIVNKYSFIQVENNFYSVPEYLVGFKVTSKIYYNKILIYSNNEFVCEHKKLDGCKKISADIRHYLKTLTFKPGALKNSYVLKSNPKLKSIYDRYYTNNPKKFIDIISKNKEKK